MWWHDGWGMGPYGWITMLLFWALLMLGIVYLWRALGLGSRQDQEDTTKGSRGDKALEILRERYARGDISKEEFEQRKRDLA
jgi:putative membrane protein